MSTTPPDFSFDLYPGLDADLDAAYERNVAAGLATPEEIATGGLAAAVQNTLGQSGNTLPGPSSHEALGWASDELSRAFHSWNKFDDLQTIKAPTSLSELADMEPHNKLNETFQRLFEAREVLVASGETTPNGANIGETMHLVLIPWKGMLSALNTDVFPAWINEMREKQGVFSKNDFFNDALVDAIKTDKPLYLNDAHPRHRMSAQDYLIRKIEQDGPWGVALVQTSDDAGLQRLVAGEPKDRTPDTLTNEGKNHFEVAGQAVDGLGIFEWLALTMQENPSELSSADYSWLLANHLDLNGGAHVPCGFSRGGQVWSYLRAAGNGGVGIRPRLAVM